MEEPLNEKSSLQIIEAMINKAKNNFSESGTLYLVWGFAVLICSLCEFIARYFFNFEDAHIVWFLTWAVAVYQVFYLSRKNKTEKVKTYTDEIIGFVWLCFIICFVMMLFILIRRDAYVLIYSAILVLYGMPAFLSGIILKVKPLIVGGICCWVLAAASSFTPFAFQGLLICAAVILAWIIPGLYMRKRFISQNI